MSDDEFEPLFDYHRVQPSNFVSIDDDDEEEEETKRTVKYKKRKTVVQVKEVYKDKCVVLDCDDDEEEDWLPPPPDVPSDLLKIGEDSTIKKLRLQRQELVSTITQDVDVEESVTDASSSPVNYALEKASEVPELSAVGRAKIIISIQKKDSFNQFRIYKDEKFERLFNNYAHKMKLEARNLVFFFDGDKINPSDTPASLDMEDDDMIEVHIKG